jgi:hypothetical protein
VFILGSMLCMLRISVFLFREFFLALFDLSLQVGSY